MLTKQGQLAYYIRQIRVNLIWIDMFLNGRFSTEEKWRKEIDRRLRNDG